jgi:hypothetical protein
MLFGMDVSCDFSPHEHRLMVVENRALRRMFGTRREGVTGICRKVHSDQLYIIFILYQI